MHRRALRVLCLVLGGWWVASSAQAAQRPADAGPAAAGAAPAAEVVSLRAPLAGEPLLAGSTSTLAWDALAGWQRLPAHAEWEAFLSLDGGSTWPFRITPHLDSDLRQVGWAVPELPSSDVRLMLRFGDERGEGEAAGVAHETTIVWPERFVIRQAAPGAWPAAGLAATARAARRGGTAQPLPGEAGVRVWIEGSRRGRIRRQVVASRPSSLGDRPAVERERGRHHAARTSRAPILAARSARLAFHTYLPRPHPARRAGPLLLAADLLLASMRLNE